jgi:acetate kinase
MATRSGSVDPGLLLHLLRAPGCSTEALSELLNRRSGLAGLAGGTGDLREVLAGRERGDPRAQLAFDVYVHRLRRAIGEMLASLGGVDAVVFTGGIGEAAPAVRAAASEPFDFLGLVLDPDHNAASPDDANIAHDRSRVSVLVIAAREDWAIARSAADVAAQAPAA